jgi:hypothetical protein
MSLRQVWKNAAYLHWGGISEVTLITYLKYFGLSTLLILASIAGLIGLLIFLSNIKQVALTNGDRVRVVDIDNKSSEAITYLFTYIIPFVFQDLSSWPDIISICVLLSVTYFIYVNSTLILINPTLNWKYALYLADYTDDLVPSPKILRAMIMTEQKLLEEDDRLLIRKVGHKLYFAVPSPEGE